MTTRRTFMRLLGAAGMAAGAAHLWVPSRARAQTAAFGQVRHLLYLHLRGGFRFTTAFNGDVAAEFNPFGLASNIPSGTEWGPSRLLGSTSWLTPERQALGMQSAVALSNRIAVATCVDHEPLAGGADGNHQSGLERFLTGYPGGSTSFLTMVNYGLRAKVEAALAQGNILLPAFSFGASGMALGAGAFAPYRPPVIQGDSFEGFGAGAVALPSWGQGLVSSRDQAFRDALAPVHRAPVDAYMQSRAAMEAYSAIFGDPILRVSQGGATAMDGIANDELLARFGDSGAGRSVALALRLFHFGCPAAFIGQGGYDYHSDEDDYLPDTLSDLTHVLSATVSALTSMQHPEGGTYWDKTLIVLGSEFGRTTQGARFNSAGGSDHSSDLATRWMSMPMLGGVIDAAGKGGRRFGETRKADLVAQGPVYSYRALLKTFLDVLGADATEVFPGDAPIGEFFV